MAFDPALAWRVVSCLMLGWLALFFGRTLRPGRQALITRIARVSDPGLAPQLVHYTRCLTAVWTAWFLCAGLLLALAVPAALTVWAGPAIWAGTAILFIGEHRLRPHFFPGETFPGLRRQLQDTLSVWRPVRPDAD
jgi:uncharacterized membrane protein